MKTTILTEEIPSDIIKKAAINSRLIDENVAVTLNELFLDDRRIAILTESLFSNMICKDEALFYTNLLTEFMSVQAFKTEIFKLINSAENGC